jgi:hypothetical protein
MSRISRYQDSINKYMKTKSCIINLEPVMKKQMLEIIEESDYASSIVLLTVLSSQNRKNKTSLHGYYMGCGIELMMIMCKLIDNREYYLEKYSQEDIQKLILKLSTLVNMCLSQNVECIQKLVSKEKTLKMFHDSLKLLTEKLFNIMNTNNIKLGETIKKTDLVKYTFKTVPKSKDKIMNLKQTDKESLMQFIKDKYISVCQSALLIGYLLGSGTENIKYLERMGEYLGIMIKISNDFKNIERDLQVSKDYTYNYVLNYGLQEAFELYMDNKTKLIEGCITCNLYSNTMKEILDVIEGQIDNILGKTKADLKSQYTLSISSSNSLK